MTPQEKINYVKDKIEEMVQISPKGAVHIDLYTLTEYEEGPILISNREQIAIINKLREDGYIKNVKFDRSTHGVWLEKVEWPKTSLDYLREVVSELYDQYQRYPIGKNIQYEIYIGRTDDDSDETLDERNGRLNAIKQLKSEDVISKYELESQQEIFLIAKCIINKEKLLEHAKILRNRNISSDDVEEDNTEKIQNEKIPEIRLDFEEGADSSPIIRSKTLQLIASEIGEFETGENLKNFLIDCGVNENLIEYPQTKWRMIYSVFVALSQSKNPKDHKTLFKIIEESAHPLMHGGDRDKSIEIKDNFTGYLQYDGYCFSSEGQIIKADNKLIKEAEKRRNGRKLRKKEGRLDESLGQLFHEFMTDSPVKKPLAQEPIPIQIVGGKMEVEGLQSGLEAIVTKNEENTITKNKRKIRLPHFSPTPWKDVEIRFLDERNIHIKGGNKTAIADYEGLGFSNEKSKKPNLAWNFLLRMSKNNGETGQIPSPVPDNIKQIKRQISDFLKKLFKNDTEPFHDISETRTYKLKIALIPPQTDDEKNKDELGIDDYLNETMVSKYEQPKNDDEW